MATLIFGTVLPWLLLGLGTWFAYQLVHQNGRILLRLEAIEQRLGTRSQTQRREHAGLPVGTPAPEFELPDLAGVRHKLSDLRGKDLLLIFFNPKCGFCTKMAGELSALPIDGAKSQPVPLVVTTGNAAANRRLVEQHGIRCTVLLQEQMEVATQYRAQGTPMGYRIDADGRIASELTVGAEPLLKLAELSSPPPATGSGKRPGKRQADSSLAHSRLNRSGLKAGAVAPEFALPRIDGGELSLAELRGQRVLLVFSDPDCGPCDELAPRLQEVHMQRPDLQVLVISRRDADATRAKADQLGLTYPVVVQKQWEISLKYGMFATPIGYLIDEQGVLLSDAAVGVEPVLTLADPTAITRSVIEPSLSGKEMVMAN